MPRAPLAFRLAPHQLPDRRVGHGTRGELGGAAGVHHFHVPGHAGRAGCFPAIEEWLRRRRRHLEWIDLRLGPGDAHAQTEAEREAQVLKVHQRPGRDRRLAPTVKAFVGVRIEMGTNDKGTNDP